MDRWIDRHNIYIYLYNQTALNDEGEFEKVYHEIFPPRLELIRKNSSDVFMSL